LGRPESRGTKRIEGDLSLEEKKKTSEEVYVPILDKREMQTREKEETDRVLGIGHKGLHLTRNKVEGSA